MDLVIEASPVPTLAVVGGGRFPVRRIYCVGRNYWDHGIEMGGNPEKEPPFFFSKPPDAAVDVSAPDATIPYPPYTKNFHHEAEMVIAIGKGGRNIPADRALEHVWGYGVGVDLTRRDLQEVAKQTRRPWDASKGFDFSAPVGALTPREQAAPLTDQLLAMVVNGQVRQETGLGKMIWSVEDMVSRLSEMFLLVPGDILFTGTPAGVGPLVVGDRCEATVEGLEPCKFTVVESLTGDGEDGNRRRLQDQKEDNSKGNSGQVVGFSLENSLQAVARRNANCQDPEFRRKLEVVVKHLHLMVKESQATWADWEAAVEFLRETGRVCMDKAPRNEFMLLSDLLGVTMLVDAVNFKAEAGATESTVLGPFHDESAPHRELGEDICYHGGGTPCHYSGLVTDTSGNPIEGATVDTWLTAETGEYSIQTKDQPEHNLSGVFTTGKDGRYHFRAIVPTSYPVPTDGTGGALLAKLGREAFRPAHIHFVVAAPGYQKLITHLFVAGDPYINSDAVFAVKSPLVLPFLLLEDSEQQKELGLRSSPYSVINFNFSLVKSEP